MGSRRQLRMRSHIDGRVVSRVELELALVFVLTRITGAEPVVVVAVVVAVVVVVVAVVVVVFDVVVLI